jgi:hypothetical protein
MVGTPTLSKPSSGARLTSVPVLSWKMVPGAATYRVEVAMDSAFRNVVARADVSTTFYQPPVVRSGTQVYYWRVVAQAPDGGASSPSGARRFTLVSG